VTGKTGMCGAYGGGEARFISRANG